jgi:hypothetical protein
MNEIWIWICNICTILSLIDFGFRVIKWINSLIIKKFGINQQVIHNKVMTKDNFKIAIRKCRAIIPLCVSLFLLIIDIYSTYPIDKILIIRIALNVSIVVCSILFLIIMFQLNKFKKSILNEANEKSITNAIIFG